MKDSTNLVSNETLGIAHPGRFFGRWLVALIFIVNAVLPITGWQVAGSAGVLPAAQAASSNIVISQVYGGGGNSGAYYLNDFIELFNASNAPVSVAGWSVQYASSAGGTWNNTTNLSGTIQPYHYYLIQEAAGTNTSAAAIPTPDVAGGAINMSGTNGKVALVNSTTSLTCGTTCAGTTGVIDYVGYGTATNYEGTAAAPTLSATTSDTRVNGGCQDTDQNSTDFAAGTINQTSANQPRNSATATNVCGTVTSGLVATPSSASFSAVAGDTATQSQAISVTATSGTISYTVSITGTGSTSWVSATPLSGTTPSAITVTVDPTGLSQGTYSANVVISDTSNTVASQSVPVTLTITSVSPVLTVSPSNLSFSYTISGSTPASQNISVTNGGVGTLDYTASYTTTSGGNWLSVTPTTGIAPANLSVSVTPTGLSAGTYTGTVTITSTADSVNIRTVGVTLTVSNAATGLTPIYTIQGAALRSPLVGQTITTTGVVIGIKSVQTSYGFYIQDPNGDGDPNTSDGVFVYTSSKPPASVILSHTVQVKGFISEYVASGTTDQPFTEVQGSAGNPLVITDLGLYTGTITPTIITADPSRTGPNIRHIPSTSQVVSNSAIYSPTINVLDFYESMESMLTEVDNGYVSGPTNAYGETALLPDNAAGATGLSARGGIYLSPTDTNPEIVTFGSDLDPVTRANAPVANVKDRILVPVVGPLTYDFSQYKIESNAIITGTQIDRSQEVTQEVLTAVTGTNQLRFASYNIENFIENPSSPTDQARRNLIAHDIAFNLQSPDIMVIDEIQDDSGATDNGVVGSNQQLDNLVAAIASNGGAPYAYRYITPTNDTDGGEPGGNIRQVFLYRTDKAGLSFVDKPITTGNPALTPNAVNPDGSLLYSPGRIDPTNSDAFTSSRKPLAGEFMFQGRRIIIIGNHLNSKGGDDGFYGQNQPPVLNSEVQRNKQTTVIRNFVTQIQTANPNAYILVAGDMNDFQWSNPLKILKNGNGTITDTTKILTDIGDSPSLAAEDYSYVYQGNAEILDHILWSQPISSAVSSVDYVHLNSEFSNADPRRGTDHDPPAIVLSFPAVGGTPDLSISKTHNGTFTAGTNVSYTIGITNGGTFSTTGTVTVTDNLPTGLTYSGITGAGWSCSAAGQAVTCTYSGVLAVNGTTSFNLNVALAGNASGSITNTAVVTTTGDTNAANNSATDVATVVASCSAYSVTNESSAGCGSLYYALTQAQGVTVPVTITFANNVKTITVTTQLPALKNVTLNGGGTCGTTGVGTPGVHLVGSGVSVGISLTGSSVITGVAITGFSGYGLTITGNGNTVSCSWIGTANGTAAAPNGGGGIRLGVSGVISASNSNLNNNLISGNTGVGVLVENGPNNIFTTNWIGYASNGTTVLSNTGGGLRTLPGGQAIFHSGNRIHA